MNVFQGFDEYSDEDNNDHKIQQQQEQQQQQQQKQQQPVIVVNGVSGQQQQQQQQQQHQLLLFTPKWNYSTKNNPLCGICFPQWCKILKQRYHQIEWKVYWPRLLVITLLSFLNSMLAFVEYILYEQKIQEINIHDEETFSSPVFVLGHPRTGTTLLQSLLALDEDQFDVCTTFCAGFPSCFLWFESIGKKLFRGVMDETRPMDNVKLDFDLPQEDELATNVLSGGISPYMPLFLMKQEKEFRPYYSFQYKTDDDDHDDDDDNNNPKKKKKNHDTQLPPDIMAEARKQWTTSFLYLVKKLTLRSALRSSRQNLNGATTTTTTHQKRKRLVLKSPVHTARIPLLLQLFPNAQFIYIHRHPYDVLRSAIHMADTTYWYTYMNTPTQEEILEFILRQYEILWEAYEEGRQQIQQQQQLNNDSNNHNNNHTKKRRQQLIEVSFDQLVQEPLKTMEDIYQQMGWGGGGSSSLSATYKTRLQEEVQDSHSTYQRNTHAPLPDYLQQIVNDRWGPSFDRLGYSKQHS